MKLRDQARSKAMLTSLDMDWSTYKTLRNECSSDDKKDRSGNLKKKKHNLTFRRKKQDSRGLYRLMKKKMGWKTGGMPVSFLVNGQSISSPKKMVDLQMNSFF